MLRALALAAGLLFLPSTSYAASYCVNQYEQEIRKVSVELADQLTRTVQIEDRLRAIYARSTQISIEMAEAAAEIPPNIAKITELGNELSQLTRERADLESEFYRVQDRVVELKGVVPADLQGRLRGCVEASAPVDQLINISIQVVALVSTGGASLLLPPKALYVDMAAVLNGYPTGGESSVINEARQTALDALGIGGENNDIGKIIKNPGGEAREFIKKLF